MINLRLIRLIIIQCWTARIMKPIFRTLVISVSVPRLCKNSFSSATLLHRQHGKNVAQITRCIFNY